MSFRDQVRAQVLLSARRRLVRELCRALESGLTRQDVAELLEIAAAAVREGRRP